MFEAVSEFIAGLNPGWGTVLVTVALVVLNAYYIIQNRKLRQDSVRPNFSLVPKGLQAIGGARSFHGLYLRNNGGTARDIEIEVESTSKNFYVSSLAKGEEVRLILDLDDPVENNIVIKIDLKFEDGYGRELYDDLKIDFGKDPLLVEEPIQSELESIKREIDDIDFIHGKAR